VSIVLAQSVLWREQELGSEFEREAPRELRRESERGRSPMPLAELAPRLGFP
jgi:hypothetical protein